MSVWLPLKNPKAWQSGPVLARWPLLSAPWWTGERAVEPRDAGGLGLISVAAVWLCRLSSRQCPEPGMAGGFPSSVQDAAPGCRGSECSGRSPGWAEGCRWGRGRGVHGGVRVWMRR